MPLWLHGVMIVFTFGLWLIVLPFILLFAAVGTAVEAAVGWVVGSVLRGLWVVVAAPFRLVVAALRAVRTR